MFGYLFLNYVIFMIKIKLTTSVESQQIIFQVFFMIVFCDPRNNREELNEPPGVAT